MFADPLADGYSNPRTSRVTIADVRASFGREEQARLHGEEINFALAAPDEPALVLGGASVYDVDRAAGRAAVGFLADSGRAVAALREGVLRSHLPFKDARRDTVVFSLLPGDLR